MHSWTHSRRTSTTISALPKQLQDIVPQCAQSCLSTYISQGFDGGKACSSGDVSCLCSEYSSYGLSLGELALICLQISDCDTASLQDEEQQAVFGICSRQSNAVRPTHSVLSPPTTTQMTSAPTSSTNSITTTSRTPVASATQSSSTENPTSTSVTAANTPHSNDSSKSAGLTSSQVIGISIAAVGFVVLAIAFAYIMACVRRRRRKEKDLKHVDGFVDDKTAHQSWFTFPNTRDDRDIVAKPDEASVFETREEPWQSQYGHPRYHETREKAAGPRISMSRESLQSSSSVRTVSRLLPEKPSLNHTHTERPSDEPVTVQTPATIFEEDRFSIIPRPIPSLPKNPRQPQYAHQFTRSLEPALPPSLSLDIPRQGTSSGAVQAVAKLGNHRDNIPKPFYENSNAASSTNSFLNYYEGPDSGSPEDFYSHTPIDEHLQIRRPAPAAILITKPMFPPAAVRTSMASDTSRRTSFESTDPDEATPPDEAREEDKRLTPVAESPIASIRYPKIPRGSNQAVPRSPPYQSQYKLGEQQQQWHLGGVGRNPVTPEGRRTQRHSPSLSGSTLAAKRLGDNAANHLERGLRIIPNGSPPHQRGQRPARGPGRPAHNDSPANWPLPSQEPLKSPLWEPKLTPRRMGTDLYLSVSVATPQQAQFFER